LLKEREFLIEIYCLAYPSQVWQIPYIEKKLEDIGLKLSINSFYGRYENKVYPDNYTQAELDILKPRLGDLNRIGYHLKGESPKGKLCNAGYTRCVIKEDSTAVRCKFCSEEKIGSILDNSLTLFNEPQPCNIDFCPYNEFDSVY
jgi:hypothetical protein